MVLPAAPRLLLLRRALYGVSCPPSLSAQTSPYSCSPPPHSSTLSTSLSSAQTVAERADCVVIGAGVVGLAVARRMAMKGRDVLVLESAPTIGTGTSSRNSEVIHAGIYYPRGSLKARLCMQGRKSLYSFCLDHGVPHKQVGKLIVATNVRQIGVLEKLQNLGKENGVEDLCLLEGFKAMQMEPQLQCVKALWSPSTGILDSHAFMLALQADAEEHGVTFAFNTSVFGGAVVEKGIELQACETVDLISMFSSDSSNCRKIILSADTVVNAAGLSASVLASKITGSPNQAVPKTYYAQGCYFSLSGQGKSTFSHLIYPIPEEGGLGIHVTLDLGGQVRFGPDVEWLKDIDEDVVFKNLFDYTVDPSRAEKFYPEVRRYYPSLLDGALKPDYAGIRPKLSGPGLPVADFVIQGEASHHVPQLVNLFGIESPGLTASLAIANMVSAMLD